MQRQIRAPATAGQLSIACKPSVTSTGLNTDPGLIAYDLVRLYSFQFLRVSPVGHGELSSPDRPAAENESIILLLNSNFSENEAAQVGEDRLASLPSPPSSMPLIQGVSVDVVKIDRDRILLVMVQMVIGTAS